MGKTGAIIGEEVLGATLIAAGVYFHQPWLIQAGGALMLGGIATALTPTATVPPTQAGNGPTINGEQTIPPERFVYGDVIVPGDVLFLGRHTERRKNNPDAEYAHIVYHITRRRRCNGLLGVRLGGDYFDLVPNNGQVGRWPNDMLIPATGKFRDLFGCYFADGSNSGDPGGYLRSKVADWDATCKLTNIVAVYAVYRFDPKVWPSGPLPTTFRIQGFSCFDPRSGLTAYTTNPALIERDALTQAHGPRGGIDSALIDDTTFSVAASVCDQTLTKTDGTVVKRYVLNGWWDASSIFLGTEEQILAAMGGTRVKTGATYKVYAAAPQAVVMALTEDDYAGPIKVTPKRSRDQIFNEIHAVYRDTRATQNNNTTPAWPQPGSNPYRTEDNGQILVKEIRLEGVVDSEQAQRLQTIDLMRNRRQIVVEGKFKPRCMVLEGVNVITLTDARYQWSAKKFQVAKFSLETDGTVGLSLIEYSDLDYVWVASQERDEDDPQPPDNGDFSAISPLILDAPAIDFISASDWGVYLGYRATDAGKRTPPGVMWRADNAAGELQRITRMPGPAIVGVCTTTLPVTALMRSEYPAAVGLTITLDQPWTLKSYDQVELAGMAGLVWVGPTKGREGKDGEIIQYRTATLVSGRTWRLSGLRRGLFGTEDIVKDHVPGELAVMFGDGLVRFPGDPSLLDITKYYVAAYEGTEPNAATAHAFAENGESKRCLPPENARLLVKSDGSGDLRVTFSYRVRGFIGWRDDIPQTEPSLSFLARLYDSHGTRIREETLTDQTFWDYPAANQVADFAAQVTRVDLGLVQRSDGFGTGDEQRDVLSIVGTFN